MTRVRPAFGLIGQVVAILLQTVEPGELIRSQQFRLHLLYPALEVCCVTLPEQLKHIISQING